MDHHVQQIIEEQFQKLPSVVQKAIVSGDIKKKFQELVAVHKLHLDQWETIENLILLTILGIHPPQELPEQIVKESGLDTERADRLVEDIAISIFKPIREELERELGAPQAKEEELSDMEKLRRETLTEEKTGAIPQSAEKNIQQEARVGSDAPPSTIPASIEKIPRAPSSGAYVPGQTSTERASVVDDPYREAPL